MSKFSILPRQFVDLAKSNSWESLLAKSNEDERISLFEHAYDVVKVTDAIISILPDKIRSKYKDSMLHAAFLHDIGKQNDEFQEKIMNDKSGGMHLVSIDAIKEFFIESEIELEYLDEHSKLVFILINFTHMGLAEETANTIVLDDIKIQNKELSRNEKNLINKLGTIIRASDGLASANNIRDATRSLERWTNLKSFIEEFDYSFLKVISPVKRGVTSQVIDDTVAETIEDKDGILVVYYPSGLIALVPNRIDKQDMKVTIKKKLRDQLIELILNESKLFENIVMQINRSMIGNEDLVTSESIIQMLKIARTKANELSKSNDQIVAIFLRFLINLFSIIQSKIGDKAREEFKTKQNEIFGYILSEENIPTKYDPYTNLIDKYIDNLDNVSESKFERKFDELSPENRVEILYNLSVETFDKWIEEVKEMETFDNSTQEFLEYDIEPLIDQFLEEMSFSSISASEHLSSIQEKEVYANTKKHLMSSSKSGKNERLICPLCGIRGLPITAKAATIGSGTKKYMNRGRATKSLGNINVCEKCIFENSVRDSTDFAFFLLPKKGTPPSIMQKINGFFQDHLENKITNKYYRMAEALLNRDEIYSANQVFIEALSKESDNPFQVNTKLNGRFITIDATWTPGNNETTEVGFLLIIAIILFYVTGLKVNILTKIDAQPPIKGNYLIKFPTTATFRNITGIDNPITTISDEKIKRLAISLLFIQGSNQQSSALKDLPAVMNRHPGEIAKILSENGLPSLRDTCRLLQLMETKNMDEIANRISEYLNDYYSPDKRGYSMHARLGPFNVLYENFRSRKLENINPTSIGGRVHRQLVNLNKKNYEPYEAAESIETICEDLKSKLSKMTRREKKQFLDDIRYSVYLLQTKEAYNRIQKSKENKGGNEDGE